MAKSPKGASGAKKTSGNGGAPARAKRLIQQAQQEQPAMKDASPLPKRAITSLQAQYRKWGDLYGAMGKTLTDLGVPLHTT